MVCCARDLRDCSKRRDLNVQDQRAQYTELVHYARIKPETYLVLQVLLTGIIAEQRFAAIDDAKRARIERYLVEDIFREHRPRGVNFEIV